MTKPEARHCRKVMVREPQGAIEHSRRATLDDILTIPLMVKQLIDEDIQQTHDNNRQGIAAYGEPWIDAGIGCTEAATFMR